MALTNKLEPFNQSWFSLFNEEKELLSPIFGQRLDEIHHVGSTSIPGMLSKPEIDILVVMKDESGFESFFPGLVSLGYAVRGEEPGPPGHWYFSKNTGPVRTHKLHLCRFGHECISEQLLFRDYLRAYPARATEYSNLKRVLSEINTSGMSEYLDGKAPFIQETIHLAKLGSI